MAAGWKKIALLRAEKSKFGIPAVDFQHDAARNKIIKQHQRIDNRTNYIINSNDFPMNKQKVRRQR